MRMIVGLGNPGEKYEKTRHNVGFMVVDALANKLHLKSKTMKQLEAVVFRHQRSSTIFAKPMTFMNDSGRSLKKLVARYRVNYPDLWLIYDDLDISLGDFKISKGKAPREHNGVKSVVEKLKTKEFFHVRVGIEAREKKKDSGEEYVLSDFSEEELDKLSLVIVKIVKEVTSFVLN